MMIIPNNFLKFVVQINSIHNHGANLHTNKESKNKGAREFWKLISFLICSANWVGLQRAPLLLTTKILLLCRPQKRRTAQTAHQSQSRLNQS